MPDDEQSKTASLGEAQVVPLDRVKPYWRNPRRVTEEAVNALRASITEFGYVQPMIVDEDYVLIVGHTRYAALRRMGVQDVAVKVASDLSPAEVKQYRLIDNKAAEMTSWNYELLAEEMEGLDSSLLTALFPEIKDTGAEDRQDFEDIEASRAQWDKVDTTVEFTCPHCYHEFEAEVTREDILAGVVRPADTTTTTEQEQTA